jgi:hypothetical protein
MSLFFPNLKAGLINEKASQESLEKLGVMFVNIRLTPLSSKKLLKKASKKGR